jgi:hypothetical protein
MDGADFWRRHSLTLGGLKEARAFSGGCHWTVDSVMRTTIVKRFQKAVENSKKDVLLINQ